MNSETNNVSAIGRMKTCDENDGRSACGNSLLRWAMLFALVATSAFLLVGVVFMFAWLSLQPWATEKAAAWVQAIAAPLAIGGAFWVGWWQAERSHRSAKEILIQQFAERESERVDRKRRELRAVHAGLVASAIALSANIHEKHDEKTVARMKSRAAHLRLMADRLRPFESPDINSDINAPVVVYVGMLDALASACAEVFEGTYDLKETRRHFLTAALFVRFVAKEVEKKLLLLQSVEADELNAGRFDVVNPVDRWHFSRGWDKLFDEYGIRLSQIVGPTWLSKINEQ